MPNCDICEKSFGIELCVNLDPAGEAGAVAQALHTEGGVCGNYGPILAAFFYCYACWKAAQETVWNNVGDVIEVDGKPYPTLEDVKAVARQMVIHRDRK